MDVRNRFRHRRAKLLLKRYAVCPSWWIMDPDTLRYRHYSGRLSEHLLPQLR